MHARPFGPTKYISKTDAILNSLWPNVLTRQFSKIRWPCQMLQQYIISADAVNYVSGIDFICCTDLHNTGLVMFIV